MKYLSPWQKKALDEIYPIIEQFAEIRKGNLFDEGDTINVRVLTGSGVVTVQTMLRGKNVNDYKIEVIGIKRSGLETKRSVFSINQECKLNIDNFAKSLDLALLG